MKNKFKTDQEIFWAGEFGDEYIERNAGDQLLAANLVFFAQALRKANRVKNCIEFGANIGMNLRALNLLYPEMILEAIEINTAAAESLRQFIEPSRIHNTSILDFKIEKRWELVVIKLVLIHIDPSHLSEVYEKIANSSSRYVIIAEYYNPTPVEVTYRGHVNKLFKRDFAGEFMTLHPEFRLRDYGFIYRGDPGFPQDDVTWFLLDKAKDQP